jgi:thiol-disulfide isomerase/thioredoxin
MPVWRASAIAALSLVNLNVATCRSPAEQTGGQPEPKEEPKVVDLPSIDTSALTVREKKEWSSFVTEQLAPCPDQPVSIAACIRESRPCALCVPAADFFVRQVRLGRSRSQAETAFRTRFSEDTVKSIEIGNSPRKGAEDPVVVVIEWADFECPFCGAAAPVLDELVEKFPNHVQLVFKNFPLSSHEHSEEAARAAMAADKQGKFWEMHHSLFENQEGGLDRKNIDRLARQIGLDMKQFSADIESEAIADRVDADRKQADKIGLRGTPMIYINGRHFELELFNLIEDLDPWISLEIEARTGKKVAAKAVKRKDAAAAAPAPSTSAASK